MAGVYSTSPFKATKLWNQLLASFKEGMKLKRKRWRLKTYDQCFSGADALVWLHGYLQNHPSFGTHVTREQAFMLLQKFLDNNVFQGVAEKSKKFQDTNRLYRFIEDIEKCENDGKDDKENFTSHNSFTNLIRIIGQRNSKLSDPGHDNVLQEAPKSNTDASGNCRLTPLASNLNKFSIAENDKVNSDLNYSTVSTVLFAAEDEECDDVYETSISGHFFTRSNSLRTWKRNSKNTANQLGTFWENEFNRTEVLGVDGDKEEADIESGDKKNEKKRKVPWNLRKGSLYFKKNAASIGKRKSSDIACDTKACQTKVIKIADKCNEDKNNLPRKAIALLGENPSHIKEVEHLTSYCPVENTSNCKLGESSSCLNSEKRCGTVNNESKYFQSNDDGVNDGYKMNVKGSNEELRRKKLMKKADSLSSILHPSSSAKLSSFPRQKRVLRRSISYNNLKRKDTLRSHSVAQSSLDISEPKKCSSMESITNSNRLYKVSSMWSIDTIGMMKKDAKHKINKVPEITAEDVEETWKSVVILSVKKLLRMECVRELFDATEISGASIMKNIDWKPSEISRDAPEWLLSAMNCLIDWPNYHAKDSILQELPSYRGFERDVYRAIKEHYHSTLSKPLIPLHLYPLVQECAGTLNDSKERADKIMQHIILLLPCWNRRQLQLLVNFMTKVSGNEKIQICKDMANRNLLIHSFFRLIVRKEKQLYTMEEAAVPIRVTNILIDSYNTIFKAPPYLRGQVDHKLAIMLGTPPLNHDEVDDKEKNVTVDDDGEVLSKPPSYCMRISMEEYEREAKENYRNAVRDLLTFYINDMSLSEKERKKRLKQFEKAYPEIYAERFASDDVSNCSTISQYSTNFKHARKPSFLTEKLL